MTLHGEMTMPDLQRYLNLKIIYRRFSDTKSVFFIFEFLHCSLMHWSLSHRTRKCKVQKNKNIYISLILWDPKTPWNPLMSLVKGGWVPIAPPWIRLCKLLRVPLLIWYSPLIGGSLEKLTVPLNVDFSGILYFFGANFL